MKQGIVVRHMQKRAKEVTMRGSGKRVTWNESKRRRSEIEDAHALSKLVFDIDIWIKIIYLKGRREGEETTQTTAEDDNEAARLPAPDKLD